MRGLRKVITGIASIVAMFVAVGLTTLLPSGEASAKTIDVNASEYGYGTYVVRAKGVGELGVFDEDTVVFYYVPLVARVVEDEKTGDYYVDLEYIADDGTEEASGGVKTITINIYDENGNLVTALSPIELAAPVDRVQLLMEEKDLPTGTYTVEAIAYDADGEMIYQPFRTQFYYEKLEVPDTGSFFGKLNITKTDYLVTGLIVFVSAVVVGILIITKTGKVRARAGIRTASMARNARMMKARKSTRATKAKKTIRSRKR